MKLNYDCVRDLLLTLESNLIMPDDLSYTCLNLDDICKSMPNYSKAEIAYTTTKLIEAEYIDAQTVDADSKIIDIEYYEITFIGHQYLDSIRDSKVWDTIKSKAVSLTFSIIQKLAETYAINKFFP